MALVLASDILDSLRSDVSGSVFTPHDADYDAARSIWNGAIDKHPAVVLRCANAEDVATAIRFGRERNLPISIRGGGHNFAGFSSCDDGLMINLATMNDVDVNPADKTAWCGGGATWGDLDAATQTHALAVTGGFISHTGVAGLTLGGGVGWLTRKAGLSCDNLVAAEVVTADGQHVTASAEQHPDLYWALRGGGGNFGVVTRFRFRLHDVGPLINLALFFYGLERGTEALRLARDVMPGLPDNSSGFLAPSSAPPAPFVPEKYHFAVGYALLIVGFGSAEEHARLIAPVRDALQPDFELVTPMPYTGLQQIFNESAPWGIRGYEKSLYTDELSDDVIRVITTQLGNKQSPLSFIPTFDLGGQTGGAYGRVADDETAFGGSRSARYLVNITSIAADNATYEADREWVRTMWESLKPYSSNSGGYVNFMNEYQEDRVRSAYGAAKYDRLSAIKARYDPDNIFRLNANIKPASS